ncbi:MAG: TIGR02679 family protein [Lachnospiraceae bacterium]
MNDKLQEFIQYLKQNRGFDRLLDAMREKYRSFGTVKGTLVLRKATLNEKDAVGGLMQRNFQSETDIRVTSSGLMKALCHTPYTNYTLDQVVKAYYGGEIRSKKEEEAAGRQAEMEYFEEILGLFKQTGSGEWLTRVINFHEAGWDYLHRHYRQDAGKLRAALTRALDAGNQLPVFTGTVSRVALFAANVTGDPHAFDYGRMESHILLYIIRYHLQLDKGEGISAVDKMRLYHLAGIRKDDLLNNTTVYGISCVTDTGCEHAGTKGFLEEREPLILTLNLLFKTREMLVTETKRVYVVENSGVFSELVEQLRDNSVSMMCTNGQMTAASQLMIEMLVKQGCEIFYSGDFDPEGLQIADKLKTKIPSIHLWHFSTEDYAACNPCVMLEKERLGKLETIKDGKLKIVAAVMKCHKQAGYQEALLDRYLTDIKETCNR